MLSPLEETAIKHLADGLKVHETAARMGKTTDHMSVLLARVKKKLQARTTAQACVKYDRLRRAT